MPNPVTTTRRRHRLFRYVLVLVVTPVLIATNLLGTVSDNPLSSELRRGLSLAFPAAFVDGLNLRLDEYSLPTLPPPPEGRPPFTFASEAMQGSDEIGIEATSQAPGESAPVSEMTAEPLATIVPADETTAPVPDPQDFVPQTPEMDISGTWTYQYYFTDHEEYIFEDVITITKQGSGYVVTSVTDSYGPVTLVDQYWSGSYLEFYYEMPASTFPYATENSYLLYVMTLGMNNGNLIMIDEMGDVYVMTRIN
jgi:hypothetical protein